MKNIVFEDAVKLYVEDKKTLTEIANVYGVSYSTIRRLFAKNGVNFRERGNIPGKKYTREAYNKTHIDDAKFIELYEKCIPIYEIANIMNTSKKALYRREKELNLKRPKSMMSRNFYNSNNDEEILEMYESGLSTTEIGKHLNLTHRTILNHLKHCGAKIRTISESQFKKKNKEFPLELTNYDDLYDMYVSRRMSKKDIAKTLNVSPNVVDRVLKSFNIKVRGDSEAKIGVFSGSKHPNWKGGRTTLYERMREYFRWSQVKETIERDGHKCQMCGETHKLQVHHIKPFKDIFDEILSEHPELDVLNDKDELYEIMRKDERFNDIDNLVTYCKKCHLTIVHGYKMNK